MPDSVCRMMEISTARLQAAAPAAVQDTVPDQNKGHANLPFP
jgi:hypothetical protein